MIEAHQLKTRFYTIAVSDPTEWTNPEKSAEEHRKKTESICHRTHLVAHNVRVEVVEVEEVGEPVLAARLLLVVRHRRPHRPDPIFGHKLTDRKMSSAYGGVNLRQQDTISHYLPEQALKLQTQHVTKCTPINCAVKTVAFFQAWLGETVLFSYILRANRHRES